MRDDPMRRVLCDLARRAGAEIMRIYGSAGGDVDAKADGSPVTAADLAADAVICDGLAAAYPDMPVVTEERAETHGVLGRPHFLVDPLDGTKEFVQRRGDFTVNIALIENGDAIAGVVYAPAKGRLFRTDASGGAVEEDEAGAARSISVGAPAEGGLRVVASKSHRNAKTDAYIAQYDVTAFRSAGSSLKFCMLAVGEADLYPRLGPTMEWDTAAAHAVLAAAGGHIDVLDDGERLRYDKAGRRNPFFVAYAPHVALVRA